MAIRLSQQVEPLPGYRLMERLGRGGYGEVWKAEAPGGLFKAIKFVYGDLEDAGDDNKAAAQELKALNRVKTIRHPFILSIERFDIIEGQLLIVMELADRNLWDRYQECRLQGLPGIPREELLRYLDEASEALDLMNQQYQIQHLDIKPQNLFLVHNHIKVADFGLAKDLEGIRATITGGVTPVYAAPETFEGWISRYCDQYSLAIVYQELLTGMRPFPGTNTRQLLLQHLTATPDLSSLPANERNVVGRALSKKPDDRFASCGEFVRMLRESQKTHAISDSAATPQPDPDKTVVNYKPPPTQPVADEPRKPDTPHAFTQPAGSISPPPVTLRGLPRLVTPGATTATTATRPAPVTSLSPAATGLSPATRQRPITFETGQISKPDVAPPERTGPGVLFPVYVVGMGRCGLQVLHELRAMLQDRFGRNNFPHWRWLFIDTDAETVEEATTAESESKLDSGDTYLARMHRPGHYVKREGMPSPESWMSTEMLYRMPRDPGTGGIRCLGRMALCDHYHAIVKRIEQDFESFLTDDALMEADRQTNLGIRSNRPRIYVVSSLMGGTGSGMLIDLAYMIRNELRQRGYVKPQLTGLLLTPPLDRSSPKNLAAANAHTTLNELHYYSQSANRYETRFDLRQPPLTDPDRPFDRCVLLNLPRAISESRPPAMERAAGLIYQESLTPLGRTSDEARDRYQKLKPPASLPLQSFGCYRISWPRHRLLEVSALRLAAATVQRWCSKDAGAVREEVTDWFESEWHRRQLEPASLDSQLRAGLTSAMGNSAEEQIETEIRALSTDGPIKADLPDVVEAVNRVINLVGKPGKGEMVSPSRLHTLLEEVAKSVTREAAVKFAKIAVHFIEQPGFRLAAAEETIRLATARLHTLIDQYDKAIISLGEENSEEFRRIAALLGGLTASRRGQAASELLTRLRAWSKKQLDFQLNRSIAATYRQMLGNAPGYVREVGICRQQLAEFAAALHKRAVSQAGTGTSRDHPILITGCKNLLEYCERIVDQISMDEFNRYEEGLQRQIRRHFRALLKVCGTLNERGPRLQEILIEQARSLVDVRLGEHSSAQELFANRPDEQSIQREMLRSYDECLPEPFGPIPKPEAQGFTIGVAADESGERLKNLIRELMPDVKMDVAASNDDIVFYREYHDLSMSEVPQAGVLGAEAVRAINDREKIETHSRTDVHWPS
jgi:eukaryotic-like serine/threonine-protein kinase